MAKNGKKSIKIDKKGKVAKNDKKYLKMAKKNNINPFLFKIKYPNNYCAF
jgi:hypothetical protein